MSLNPAFANFFQLNLVYLYFLMLAPHRSFSFARLLHMVMFGLQSCLDGDKNEYCNFITIYITIYIFYQSASENVLFVFMALMDLLVKC